MALEQALTVLQESIGRDVLLRDANLEPHVVANSLAFHKNDVAKTLKALTQYANWHKEILGHQSKRVSIAHVHAFLLTEIFTFLPNALGPGGLPIILFRAAKDNRVIPKQHFANLNMWLFYWSQKFDSSDHYLFIDFEGYKFKHFRPSEYKVLNESTACQPTPPAASTLFACNASKVAVKLWDAIRRILKDVPYPTSRFIKREEMSNFMDVAQIPVDFGGLRSMVDTRSDMEEFIREEYAREGLRYEPIDIKSINWKTYKIPDIDLTVRPESAMSISSNIDFDQIDAQLEKLGLDDSEE